MECIDVPEAISYCLQNIASEYIIVRYCIEIASEGTRLLGLHQQKTNSAGKFISWMTG